MKEHLKILFLPINIASMQAITAEALNNIDGVEAKSLVTSIHKYQSVNDTTIVLPERYISRKKPLKRLSAEWFFAKELKKWMEWADVLHYVWGSAYPNAKDLKWAKKMGKPVFIEWLGSDIRDPEFLFPVNPYYKQAFYNGYECREMESRDHKKIVQEYFYEVNAIPTLCPEMSLFLNKQLFPQHIQLMQRINLKEFSPEFPSAENVKPLIVHSPSAKITKGSNFIISVIEELKKDYDFEFVLLHDMSREEVLKIIKKADIFLDQLIVGGYGMATMEGMAFGKPVMCHLLPQVFEAGLPQECPVVNTNPDNLKEQLIKLITNPQLRHDTGRQSRAYVEKYHDAEKIAKQLLNIYSEALEAKKINNA